MIHVRKKKATTLIEALVYLGLVGFLFTCIYGVLISSMKYYKLAENSTELQNNAMIAVVKMVNELSETRYSTISSGGSPAGIIFLSPRNSSNAFEYDSSGQLYWQKWVCYYIGTDQNGISTLIRKERYLAAKTATPPSNTYTTASFSSDGTLTPDYISRYATSLTFTTSGAVSIQADFEKLPSTDYYSKVEITSKVFPRN